MCDLIAINFTRNSDSGTKLQRSTQKACARTTDFGFLLSQPRQGRGHRHAQQVAKFELDEVEIDEADNTSAPTALFGKVLWH